MRSAISYIKRLQCVQASKLLVVAVSLFLYVSIRYALMCEVYPQ